MNTAAETPEIGRNRTFTSGESDRRNCEADIMNTAAQAAELRPKGALAFGESENSEVDIMCTAAQTAEIRRKTAFASGESEVSTSSVNFKTRRLAVAAAPPVEDSASSVSFGESSSSSSELKSVDLKQTNVVMFATTQDFTQRRQMRPPRKSISRRRRSASEKMPTEAELEDFFAAAEKTLQKQFLDKYNYDTVKDEPKEGRYEWVQIRIKPCLSLKKEASTV